jgi:hypothetical protein
MRKRILQSSFVLGLASIFMFGVQSPNGKPNYTGGHGESNCTSCHSSYAVNSGSGNITISCASMTNWQYVPGTSYTINVTIAHPSRSAYGIDFQALNSSNTNAGTLTAGTGTHISTSGGKTNIIQSTGGGTGTVGSHTFSFTWLAPSTDVGTVTFYCAGMACNSTTGNSNEASDYVYTTSQALTADVSSSVNEMSLGEFTINNQSGMNAVKVSGSAAKSGMMTVKMFNLAGQELMNQSGIAVNAGDFSRLVELPADASGSNVMVVMMDGQVVAKKKIWK